MSKIVFIASHAGYPMDRTPLGGGAMVALRLIRQWTRAQAGELVVLGSGPVVPDAGAEYVRLPHGSSYDVVRLSEFEYGRFCREFEEASTAWLLARRGRFDPQDTCVLVNDVAEGPSLAPIAAAGYPIVSLWHADVVDYVSKIYLHSLVSPERLAGLYERCRRLGISGAAPDLLRIIFEKQSETVTRSARLIVPSCGMAQTLLRCYGGLRSGIGLAARLKIVPWGAFEESSGTAVPAHVVEDLRGRYAIGSQTIVLATLSRISPEKGIHLLLEALSLMSESGRLKGKDVVLLICGESAFMRGASYFKRVRAAAERLRGVRVFFPGYLDAPAKKAHLSLAHLFVSPSVHESYGLSVAEAMQAGLAVLASDHYGVQEMLDAGCGRVVSYAPLSGAPAGLAAALEELLADPEGLRRMGRLARERAAGMTFGRAADTVLETCREVLSKPVEVG